ncbi:hypothetical protein GCM10009838_37030 [Catenulispora subtropica]|uniref:Uncharacterized protein n=1 Tax=Catenulispora subtropica TaxID=450798 RepID=A0ABP5D799_9ACTN
MRARLAAASRALIRSHKEAEPFRRAAAQEPGDLAGGEPRDRMLEPQGISPAATVAPSSQQASRSVFAGVPVTVTGWNTRSHPIPPAMDSIARSAPPVSLLPWM